MKKWTGFQHGVNLGGWLSQCTPSKQHFNNFITENDIATIASWGLDHIRLPIDYTLIEKENQAGSYLEEGFSYIDKCIVWCRKYRLHMVLCLDRAAGYSLDNKIAHANASSFFTDEESQARFVALWIAIVTRYKGDSDIVAFELLNEVYDDSGTGVWNRIVTRTLDAIRPIVPKAFVVVGSNHWNSINELRALGKPYDNRIIYNFHFYEPYPFTHQKAYWIDRISKNLLVDYPGTGFEYRMIADDFGEKAKNILRSDDEDIDSSYLNNLLLEAVRVAQTADVPLYCSAYGVIDQAPIMDSLRWFHDIKMLFDRYYIGRCVWNYKEMDFAIIGPHYKMCRRELISCL